LLKLLKWFLPLILLGCQLEPEIVYVPEIYEIRDTLYVQVHDTSYVESEASFGITSDAILYPYGLDSLELGYWYAVTKLDSTLVDSVFLTGHIIKWNDDMNWGDVMDKTYYVPWPDNARDWNIPFSYSHGEFFSKQKWAIDDWPINAVVSYTMELEYK
jgi:hypothetical protein